MDLANLGFVVETQSIKDGIEALRQLQAAALGVTQTFKSAEQSAENLGKTTEQSEDKAAQATEQSTRRKKKSQDDYLTFLSNALDKELERELRAQQRKEQVQKSSAKSSSKVVADSAQEEQSSIDRTIEKLRIKKQEIAAGARSSEATAVAIAKLGGASEQQIKTIRDLMREINSIGGKNPFDSVVGELRRVKEEARAFQAIIDASNKEIGLTAKELQEIASLTSKINSIGKDTGATQDEINRRVEAATSEYKEQVRQKNLLKEKVDDIAEAERIASQAASANKRVQEQISDELKKQALLKEGFSKREAGFIVSAGRSGVSEVDAIALLAAENTTEELAKANEKLAKTSKDVTVSYDAQVRAYEKNQDSVQRNLEATRKKLEQVKIEASLAAQGLSRTTAVGVANLQQRGASQADIDTYIKTRKEIERITAEARKASLASRGLSTILREISPAVGAVGVVALFTQIGVAAIKAADQMTLLTSRMKLVSGEGANLVEVQNNLLKTANESRASLSDVTTLYVRIAPALRKIGFDTKDTATVVDSFSKSLLISGANSREASAAILQFSQALAAGRLNGDEFRSISEAAPEFLRIFAEATGVAAGALKDLSAEGELTTEVISSVLLVMNKDIAKTAANIDVSFSQAIQVLGNNLLVAVDSLNKMTGATNALANATIAVGEFVGDATKEIIFFYESNRELIGTLGKVIGFLVDATTVFGIYKGLLVTLPLIQKAWTATMAASSLALATVKTQAGAAVLSYSLLTTGTTAAAGATGVLTAAVRGLTAAFAANPVGFIATVLTTVAAAYIFAADATDEYKASVDDAADTTEQKLIKNLVKEQVELQRLIDLQKERQKQLEEQGSKRNAGDTQLENYGGKKFSDVIDAQAKAAGDAERQLESYRTVIDQSSVAWQNATRIIEEFKAKHKDVPAELDAEFKALQTVTGENAKLKAQLDAVGKSSLQLAEAKAIELTATAGIIEANATELALKGNLNDSTIAQINSALLRADALREQAKLVVDLAKKEQQFSGGRGPTTKSSAYEDFIKAANKTLESVSKLNVEEEESVRLVKELQVLLPKLSKSKIDDALAIIAQVSAQEDKNKKDKEAAKIQQEIDDLVADEEKIRKDLIKTQESSIKSLEEENAKIEEEILLLGRSSSEIRQYEIEKKRAQLQGLTNQEDIKRLEREIKLLEERNEKLRRKEGAEAAIKAAEDVKKEFEKIQDDIAKAVGDAIIQGGQKGKDILKNMFKAQIFRIFVEPSIRGFVGSFAGALGFGGTASAAGDVASAASTAGGLGNLVSGVKSAFNFVQNGFTSIGNAAFDATVKLADYTRLSLESTTTLANGAAVAAQYLAGIGGGVAVGRGISGGYAVGGGTGNSAVNIGTTIGAIAGGPLGALIGGAIGGTVNRLFGRKTVLGASGVEGNFNRDGLSNARGFQDVTQKGGLFRSDKSFTNYFDIDTKAIDVLNEAFVDIKQSVQSASRALKADFTKGLETFSLSGRLGSSIADVLKKSSDAFVNNIIEKTLGDAAQGFKDFLNDIKTDQEQLADVYVRVSRSVDVANRALFALGQSAQFSIRNAETAVELINQLGNNGVALLDQFVQKFVPAADAAKIAAQGFQEGLKNLGIDTKISATTTREQFRKLVQGLDLTTAAGQRELITLLSIMPELDNIITKREQEEAATKALSLSIVNNVKKIRGDFTSLITSIQSRANGLSPNSFRNVISSVQTALNNVRPKPFVDFTKVISSTVPTDAAYRKFIKEIGKQQPETASYLNFVDAIEGFTPNTKAYKTFTEAVSGIKPTDVAYKDFVNSVQGLKPSDVLYKAFVDAVSSATPSSTKYFDFIAEIQAQADSVKTTVINTALKDLQDQIDTLNDEVVTVDFSAFTSGIDSLSTDIINLNNKLASTTDVSARLLIEGQLTTAITDRYALEQQMLGGVFATIQDLFGEIKNGRVAVREAAIDILGGPRVMTPDEIRTGIRSTGAFTKLPVNTALKDADSKIADINADLQSLSSGLVAERQNKSALDSALVSARNGLNSQIDLAKAAVTLFNSNSRAGSAFATNSAGGPTTASFDEATLKAAFDYAYITYNIGDEASSDVLRDQLNNVSRFSALMGESIVRAIESANYDIKNAQARVRKVLASIADSDSVIATKAAELATAETDLLEAEKERQVALQKFAEDIQKFVIDSGKATSQLGKLREETVRYFQEQQRLAQNLIASSQGLRQTVSDIRFNDLNPFEQYAKLRSDFYAAELKASLAQGDELARAGDDLNSLINPLLQKAQEVFASGETFQGIKEEVLRLAGNVATRIEQLTPVNYQQESLDLLDTIDTTLALIENNTKSAEQLIVDAIGRSGDKTVQALSLLYKGLTGEDIPAFAAGGYHFGGTALVGEQGPELVNMGNSRVFNASQTAAMLGGNKVDMKPVVEVLQRVQERTEFQIRVLQEGFKQMDERQSAMQEELQDIRKKGNLERQKQSA